MFKITRNRKGFALYAVCLFLITFYSWRFLVKIHPTCHDFMTVSLLPFNLYFIFKYLNPKHFISKYFFHKLVNVNHGCNFKEGNCYFTGSKCKPTLIFDITKKFLAKYLDMLSGG